MKLSNGYIIDAYHELVPDYKNVTLFQRRYFFQSKFAFFGYHRHLFLSTFGNDNFLYATNGREALNLALSHYNLAKTDCVTILTTTGNFYISGCVTKEIEKFCTWSREIEANTKIIFVNHEFGYPYQRLSDLKKYKLPIIEDCAFSFFSTDLNKETGNVGDFVIYSFPKMFPIQVGGLLKCNLQFSLKERVDKGLKQYLKNVLSHYIFLKDMIVQKRQENYLLLTSLLKDILITPKFDFHEEHVPGAYLFKSQTALQLPELKRFMGNNGVQCSVFYGDDAFFIPVHQNLSAENLNYFRELIGYFIKNNEG